MAEVCQYKEYIHCISSSTMSGINAQTDKALSSLIALARVINAVIKLHHYDSRTVTKCI